VLASSKGGVPTPFFPITLKYYFNREENTVSTIDGLRKKSAEFDGVWADYMRRFAVVRKAVAEASSLRKQGDHAKADAALRAVISAPDEELYSDIGLIETHDEFLLPIDAESLAIDALIKSARARDELHAVFELLPQAITRRNVGDDTESQRLVYFAYMDRLLMRSLGDRAPKSIGLIYKQATERKDQSLGAAKQLYLDLLDSNKLVLGNTYGKPNARKGDWILIGLPSIHEKKSGAGVTRKKVDLVFEGVDRYPYACRETAKIDWISPTGTVHYRETCKYREERKPGRIKASLEVPPPAKAMDDPNRFWLVGKVKSTASGWQLEQARIYDLRYLDIEITSRRAKRK
jgi:hypothetical protein